MVQQVEQQKILTMETRAIAHMEPEATQSGTVSGQGTGMSSSNFESSEVKVLQSQAVNLLGGEVTSSLLANLIGQVTPDIPALLEKAGMVVLPHQNIPDAALFMKRLAETMAAEKEGRRPFVYVDLIAAAVLPMWSSPSIVGGEALGDEVVQLDPNAVANSVASLTSALKAACHTTRFFRSMAQWVAAWSRYKVAATACDHLTNVEAEVYVAMILQTAEEYRVAGKSIFLMFLYDEMFRRSIIQRLKA